MQRHQKILAIALLSLIPMAYTLAFYAGGALEIMELRLLDVRHQYFNPGRSISEDVIILEADIQTLDAYSEDEIFGRWPWDRRSWSPILKFVMQGAPRKVLFDIMFLEQTPNDGALAEATAIYPPLSHAATFSNEEPYAEVGPQRDPGTGASGADAAAELAEDRDDAAGEDALAPGEPDDGANVVRQYASGLPPSLERLAWPVETNPADRELFAHNKITYPANTIAPYVQNLHSVSFGSDTDGIARRFPPLFEYKGRYFPSLGLSGFGATHPPARIELSRSELRLEPLAQDQSDFRIPLVNGRYLLYFYPHDEIWEKLKRYSLAAVVESERSLALMETAESAEELERLFNSMLIDPGEFTGKTVLIAATAPATHDVKPTPYGRMPGVFLHAVMLSNLLQGDHLYVVPGWVSLLATFLLLPLGVSLVLYSRELWARVVLPALILVGYVAAALLLFQFGMVVLGMAEFLVSYPLAFLASLGLLTFLEGRDKFKFKSAMSKYLSPSVLNDVIKRKSLGAEVGERREMSVMFTDIRSFTTMSEQMDAAEVVALLNEYLNEMVDIIFSTEGTLDKFIGDAIMAFWNAPNEQSDHARRAVETGMRMSAALRAMHPRWAEQGRPLMQMGVGVNTGDMIVGNIGGEKRLDFTVIGDNVNLGSRLEGLTKNYGVDMIISESTYRALDGAYACRILDLVAVKGKARPIRIFEPLNPEEPPRVSDPQTGRALSHAEYAERNQAAFQAYLDSRWDEAIALYRSILHTARGEDLTAQNMIQRCEIYKQTPPPSNWDGSFVMKTK